MIVFNIFMIKINAVLEASAVNVGESINWKPKNFKKSNLGAGQFYGDHTTSPVISKVVDPDLLDSPVSAVSIL